MAKRSRGRPARHHPLSIRDRDILIFWYANPDLTRRKLSSLLLLSPGELSRLRRLKAVKEKIAKNMSKRMGLIVEEEQEVLGPKPLSEVEDAQKIIVDTLAKMETQGETVRVRSQDIGPLV